VVVVAWGEMPLLSECVDALAASRRVDVEIVVVDNGCTDGTVDALLPGRGLRVLRPGTNLGFAGGCNAGAEVATGDVVAFVNPDAIVSPDALAALADATADPAVGIATARLRLLDEPDLLNSSGGSVHFLGIGWADGFRRPAATETMRHPVTNASGAAMAMRSEVFRRLEGFTPEFFLYHEDCELSLRTWLVGLRVEFVPEADVWHAYHFSRNIQKYYFLERNRLILVASLYQAKTLAMLAPALVALELGMVLLAAVQGWLPQKVAGWRWIVRHRRWLRDHRRRFQALRTISDRELAPLLSARFDAGQVEMPAVALPFDWALGRYWALVSALL
jgi:GT2 family glycosyltransferase